MFLTSSHCLKSIQRLFFVLFLINTAAIARGFRAPANVVPDDDMIVVPLNIEGNIYEDFNEKHKEKFKASRAKLNLWMANEQYAQDYGLEDTGFIHLPTEQEKQDFLKRNYLRFITKDIQKSSQETIRETQDNLRTAWKNWTTNDEIDSIQEREDREEFSDDSKAKLGGKSKELETRLKVGKKSFKLRFQPRIEQGMVKITFKSDYLNFKAYLGINGNQEIKFDKFWKKTRTKALVYYYIDQARMLASLDQNIKGNLNFRFAHEKSLDGSAQLFGDQFKEINSMQIRFNMGF